MTRDAQQRYRRPGGRAAAWWRGRDRAGKASQSSWREMAGESYDVSHPVQFVPGHPATSQLSAAVLTRTEAIVLLVVGALALIVSGIGPADRTTWWLEVFPIFIAV